LLHYHVLDSFESVDSGTINHMQNIIQYKGTTKILPITLTKTVDDVTTPFNLNGYTATLTIKKNKEDADADALITKSVTAHTDAPNGITQFTIDPADTVNMDFCDYVFDIQLENGTDVRTVYVGHWEIQEKVKD